MQDITGIDYYAGGLYTPGCVQIQPAAYIRGLAEGLRRSQRNQISIFEHTPVNTIKAGDHPGVTTNHGKINGGKIILTVNGHLASFGLYRKQLMHMFTFASMTRTLSNSETIQLGGRNEWGVTPAHPMGSTIRKTRENRIVVRNTFTYNPNMKTSKNQVDKLGRKHDRSFRNRFPMLGSVSMEHRWGGHLCLARNSTPVFGELEKNLFVSCCQNGLGTVKGTLGGMLVAELAAGQQNSMIDEMLSYDQPSKLPPEPLMTIGARSYLWWHQSKAGKDL
jgi:glycine/D-amino acid oxidase-like deaminating enzyme